MLLIYKTEIFFLNIYDEPSKSSRHSWLVGRITLFPVIMICPRLWLRINDNQIRICFEFGRVLPISVFLLLSTTSLYQGYTVHNNLSCSIHKVHIFWEGHKILRNLPLTFVLCTVVCIKVRTASFPRFWKNHP